MKASKTIKFQSFQLQTSYDYTLPEKRTWNHSGYPGNLEVTEVIFQPGGSDITDLVMEFPEVYGYIENQINDDLADNN